MTDKIRIVYVTVCLTCGGKTWCGPNTSDEQRPLGRLVWLLPEPTAEKLRWCDCAAQAYEVDTREAEASE